MKPTIVRNRMLYLAPQHVIGKQLGSPLSKDLRQKYTCRSARVVEGDTVKVLRGEFKGIEGKVTKVSTEKRGVAIEGIKREKLKGGNVDIYIHASNLMITALNLEDKWRQNRLEGQKTKNPKSTEANETKESPLMGKPKEQKEIQREEPKETKKKIEPKNPKTKKQTRTDDKSQKIERPKRNKSKENK